MLNWQTILTSTLLSGTLISVILFVFKKTFEKGIETKFKEIENRQRLNLEEDKRRQGKIFDDQYDLLKTILALTYRVRNGAREIMNLLNKTDYKFQYTKEFLHIQDGYHKSLETLLFDNKALLPDSLFGELHDLKHCINRFNSNLYLLANKEITAVDKIEAVKVHIKDDYNKLEQHYLVMTGVVQSTIGLHEK